MGQTLPFRRRLYMVFVGSLLVPILAVALITTWFFTTRSDQDGLTSRSNTLATLADTFQTNLDELNRIAFTPYLYKETMNALLAMQNGYFLNPPPHMDLIGLEKSYETTLRKLMFTAKQRVDSISFYPIGRSETHVYRLSRNTAGIQVEPVAPYVSEQWFRQAMEGEGVYTLDSQGKENDEQLYYFDAVITDMDTKKDMGVLRIETSPGRLLEPLREISLSPGSQLLLVDSQGVTLAQNGEAEQEIGNLNDDASLASDFLISKRPVKDAGWNFYYLTSKSVNTRSTIITFGIALIVAACTTLMAFIIYRKESSATVSNVDDILSTLTKIQNGDFSAKTNVASEDELGVIAIGVNKMGAQIVDHIDKEYAAVINRQEAEYRALQAQIDPHFFYNTLNDIIALNRMGEKIKVEESLRQITRLFRYSCSTADTTTVQEEIGFCEQYLWLRKLQLEERLHFSVFVEPEVREFPIPKFILQPIIENCVKHGMGKLRSHLSISISAVAHDDSVTLTVTDDGVGFDQESPETSSNFGLENVRQRLHLGVAGSEFTLRTAPHKGVQVVITIPQPALRKSHMVAS